MRKAERRGVGEGSGGGSFLSTLHIEPVMLSSSGCGYMGCEDVIGLDAKGGVGGGTWF